MVMLHYYHVYAINDWKRIVDEHLDELSASGLYENLDQFNIGIVGTEAARTEVVNHIWVRGYEFDIVGEADTGWEQVTLLPMWAAARAGDAGTVLYAHTKGVWRQTQSNEEWRAAMLRHLVTKWEKATSLLGPRVQVVGSHRLDDVWPYEAPHWLGNPGGGARRVAYTLHLESGGAYQFDPDDDRWFGSPSPSSTTVFSGNWWWTTMDWVRSMPPPKNEDRFNAEQWIGSTEGHRPLLCNVQPGWPS